MKYCVKCGAELPDDAEFCSKCGAAQKEEVRKEQVKPAEPQMSDSERYEHLVKTDPKFVDTVRVSRKVRLVGLINLLFVVPWIVNLFTPVGEFTGVGVTDEGRYIMSGLGKSFPVEFSAFGLRTYKTLAGRRALTPGGGLDSNVFPLMIFIFGFVFFALLILVALLGNTKGYNLKTYEKDGGKTLYEDTKKSTLFLFGGFLAIVTLGAPLATYFNCTDINYPSDKSYIFGRVDGIASGLITCVIVTIVFATIMIVVSAVLRSVILKKLDKYYK